ncbi:MAG: hypothetical protein GY936_13250 [Ignavibacteriae bacterium]|nr:hypothetical protein [Ignavibacteriota bacterium]
MGIPLYLLVLMAGCTVIIFGLKNPLFGLLFSFAAMNSFFNLIPVRLFPSAFVNKTWDLGFIFMILFGGSLLVKRYTKMNYLPFYIKVFSIYLIICVISFILTIIKYPLPFIDAFRTFRYHLGYFFFLFLLQYFLQAKDGGKALNKLLKSLYIISFILLLIYNIQFVIQKPLFLGYNLKQTTTYGASFLRSIPNFLFICYFFLWFNLSAWFLNKQLFPLAKFYMPLCVGGVLFSFTRGIYLTVFVILILIIFMLLNSRRYNPKKILIVSILGVVFFSTAYAAGVLKPFLSRASTISQDTLSSTKEGSFWYRIGLVEDRIRLIKDENPLLGLGFVHNKYGSRFGKYRGNYDESIKGPALGCADIAWGNIIFQTGWLGFSSFALFVISLIYYAVIKLRKKISTIVITEIFLIEFAAVVELLRMTIQAFNSSTITSNTQNPSLMFAIAGFAYILQQKSVHKKK